MMVGDLAYVNSSIELSIDLKAYRLSAVKKAGYRLAERCTAIVETVEGTTARVALRFRANTSEASARETARLFYQELLDQELREEIAEETAPLRTLILAQAFSKADLIRRE